VPVVQIDEAERAQTGRPYQPRLVVLSRATLGRHVRARGNRPGPSGHRH